MSKQRGGTIRYIYGVLLALLTVFVGGLIVWQTWQIFRSAPRKAYTVASISKHFKEIALPVWVWLGALGGNILLALIFPLKEKRPKAYIDPKLSETRAKRRLPTDDASLEKGYKVAKRSGVFRAVVATLFTVIALAGIVLATAILLDKFYRPVLTKGFFAKHNGLADRLVQVAAIAFAVLLLGCIAAWAFVGSRKRAKKAYTRITAEALLPKPQPEEVAPVLEETVEVVEQISMELDEPKQEEMPVVEEPTVSPWTTVIDKVVGALFLGRRTTERELKEEVALVMTAKEKKEEPAPMPVSVVEEAPKKAPVVKAEKPKKKLKIKPAKPKKNGSKVGVNILRVAICIVGVALVAFGVYNGGMKDVLAKAVNICTQCIGLG